MIYPQENLGDVLEALFQQKFALAKILLSQRAHIDFTDDGYTPLYRVISAFHCEHLDIVEFLLEAGADPNHRQGVSGYSPITALFLAAGHNLMGAMELLLKYGGKPNSLMGGTTCLHISAINPRVEMLQLLLDYGADYGVKDDEGELPIDTFEEVLSWKIERGNPAYANETLLRQMISPRQSQ